MMPGSIALFRIAGRLGLEETKQAQSECESVLRETGEIRILVVLNNFEGWTKEEGWEGLSFAERNDPYIRKLAITGDPKWKELAYVFTLKGLRPVPIEFFDTDKIEDAIQWLNGD
jgi:hypothetical protein